MRSAMQILLVDNELTNQTQLTVALQQAGYAVQVVGTGQAALDLHAARPINLVLLETYLPDMPGFVVCAELRKRSRVPIVLLTSLKHSRDIQRGFSVGADDYITKPFHLGELIVRLRAVLRRSMRFPVRYSTTHNCSVPELRFKRTKTGYIVEFHGKWVACTPREYQLLYYLVRHPNRPISKHELGQTVWGYQVPGDTNFVEAAIRRLRKKIEVDPANPRFLLTVRGAGYLFQLLAAGAPDITL